jgi:hypothetical protein
MAFMFYISIYFSVQESRVPLAVIVVAGPRRM